jgi:hypothetical protein
VRQQLRVRGADAPRCLAQTRIAHVATQRDEQVTDRPLGALGIDRDVVAALGQRARRQRGDSRRTAVYRAQRRGAS